MNRDVFEAFQKSDVERMRTYPSDSLPVPVTEVVYAMKIIPEKNITIFPVVTRFTNHLMVMDDAGNELINTSDVMHGEYKIGYLNNHSYIQPGWIGDIPRMDLSGAYLVQFSFEGNYGWPLASRFSINNQDVIVDEGFNVTLARSEYLQLLS